MIRFLYLGRQTKLPQEIETVWQNTCSAEPALQALHMLPTTSQAQAMDMLHAHSFCAILLEMTSQSQYRTQFCQNLRRRYPELRIFAICHQPPDPKLFAFDGLLRLPLCHSETEALLRSVCSAEEEMQLQSGPIHLDVATRTLQGPRGQHHLPPKQCNLLRILITHAGEVVHRKTIMRMVWETDYLADTRTLDVHVRWLREKIEPDPDHPVHLLTVRGQGYQLVTH